jgi:hypothetical protein
MIGSVSDEVAGGAWRKVAAGQLFVGDPGFA